jgi:HK97 family phage prohead protease
MKKDYIKDIDGGERRFYTEPMEYRKEGDEEFFEGYAALFNRAADLGWFSEEIDASAFDDVLDNDVRGLFNHDPDVILGRNKSGTMTLTKDEKGMRYKIRYNPNDPDHVRVMEKVKRGDISQSSFAFSIKDAVWETKNEKDHRKILKLSRWYDVAPVTYPAYPDTTVAARSKEGLKKEVEELQKLKAEQLAEMSRALI